MKQRKGRLMCCLAAAVLFFAAGAAGTEQETDLDMDELLGLDVEEIEIEDIETPWLFPVALKDLNPEYIRLANKHYLLEKDYVPEDLVKVPKNPEEGGIKWAVTPSDGKLKGMYLREECARALCEMNAAMRQQEGFRVMYLKSAYRSYSKQKPMYHNRLASHNGKDDGWVSREGASDHQTGLGCDVVPSNWKDRGMNEKMMREKECQWMAEHCQEYGFVIRYPADKKSITEINTEPWHLRYVGIPAATYIMENGLCLEEFAEELKEACMDYIGRGGDPEKVTKLIQTPTDEQEE